MENCRRKRRSEFHLWSETFSGIISRFFFENLILHIPKFCSLVHWFRNCLFSWYNLSILCGYFLSATSNIAPTFEPVITIDLRSMLLSCFKAPKFGGIFSGISHLTIFSALNYAPQISYFVYLALFGRIFECADYEFPNQSVFVKHPMSVY